MGYKSYIDMQKAVYERDVPSSVIIPNTKWNDGVPHENMLLYLNGDVRYPIFENTHDKIALDFACGPGRMIPRLSKFFKRVDGVDISSRLIAEAKATYPDSNFWVTAGDDLGGAPKGAYDFIYSTVAMQHIAVHSIRMNILENMRQALNPQGCLTLQFAFNWQFPWSKIVKESEDEKYKTVVYEKDDINARWPEDRIDASSTNGACDVGIGRDDVPLVMSDFQKYFQNVKVWFFDYTHCNREPNTLGGRGAYWATHFMMVYGER